MSYKLVCESLNENHSFVLNLSHPNMTKLQDIEKTKTPDGTSVYSVKYVFKKPMYNSRMIRINSLTSDFSVIHSVDLCDKAMKPKLCIELSPNNSKDSYVKLFNKFFSGKADVKQEGFNPARMIRTFKAVWKEMMPDQKIMVAGALINLLMMFISLSMFLMVKIIKLRKYAIERHAASVIEQEINNHLFKNQTGDEPVYVMYHKLTSYLNSVINGNQSALILCGPPGMSKSYMVRRVLHFSKKKPYYDYIIQKGATATIDDVYQMLYDAKDGILILDDFDTPLKDSNMLNMLKSVTDTYIRRVISRPKQKITAGSLQAEEVSDVPDRFVFNGKIILITNLLKKDIDLALRSRAPVLEVYFDTKTVIESLNHMLEFISPSAPLDLKEEVYQYILSLYKDNPKINMDFRKFQSSVDARVGVPNEWKDIVKLIITES